MPRGRDFLAEYAANLREQRDTAPLVVRCLFCPWTHEGTLKDGREAAQTHRLQHHPGARQTRRKHAHNPSMLPDQGVEENLSRARAEGAGAWA